MNNGQDVAQGFTRPRRGRDAYVRREVARRGLEDVGCAAVLEREQRGNAVGAEEGVPHGIRDPRGHTIILYTTK